MDVLLLREMERLSVQPVQAVVADGGCDVGRQICLGSNPLPVFPEGGEALHHDVFRYGSVTHIPPRDYHKPRVILRIYLLKLRMSDTPPHKNWLQVHIVFRHEKRNSARKRKCRAKPGTNISSFLFFNNPAGQLFAHISEKYGLLACPPTLDFLKGLSGRFRD